jgi:hypothetical protein
VLTREKLTFVCERWNTLCLGLYGCRNGVYVLCTHVEITSLTRHILEIMVSKFSNIMININKVIDNRSTFFSGGVTSCTRILKTAGISPTPGWIKKNRNRKDHWI